MSHCPQCEQVTKSNGSEEQPYRSVKVTPTSEISVMTLEISNFHQLNSSSANNHSIIITNSHHMHIQLRPALIPKQYMINNQIEQIKEK